MPDDDAPKPLPPSARWINYAKAAAILIPVIYAVYQGHTGKESADKNTAKVGEAWGLLQPTVNTQTDALHDLFERVRRLESAAMAGMGMGGMDLPRPARVVVEEYKPKPKKPRVKKPKRRPRPGEPVAASPMSRTPPPPKPAPRPDAGAPPTRKFKLRKLPTNLTAQQRAPAASL